MSELKVNIYTKGDRIPEMGVRFFHSAELFHLCEKTPRLRPYMVVVVEEVPAPPSQSQKEGLPTKPAGTKVVAHMLAMLRYRTSWFPPYWYMHCRVYGEGEGSPKPPTEKLFGMMLDALMRRLPRWVLYVEVSDLSGKMFGYRQFRQQNFFPVHWMSVHNSLHSHAPEERINERMKQRIIHATERGAQTKEVETEEEFCQFMKLLKSHHWFKPKRYIPDEKLFRGMMQSQNARLFITKHKEKVIGCCACTYSGSDAYLWYSAFRRKSYARLHPDIVTVWHAITHAYEHRYEHIRFMDVGLPFRRNPYREFILSFGGKPVSTYRWFKCNIRWVNSLLSWIYKD